MNSEAFQLNKLRRLIRTQGKQFLVDKPSFNKFNEPDGNFTFSAKLRITEMLGSKKIVYVDCNGKECLAEMPAEQSYQDEVTFNINTNKLLFFDPETEMRIN